MTKITAKKYMGDDTGSWAIFVNGRPVVTGLTKREISYYKKLTAKALEKASILPVDKTAKAC